MTERNDYDLIKIHALLIHAYNRKDLREMIEQTTPFKRLSKKLRPDDERDDIADKLLEYALSRDLLETLLAQVEEDNPSQYQKREPFYLNIDEDEDEADWAEAEPEPSSTGIRDIPWKAIISAIFLIFLIGSLLAPLLMIW